MERTALPLFYLCLTLWVCLWLRNDAEHIPIQEVIVKLSRGIELPAQSHKLRQLFVQGVQMRRRHREELSPVGARMERSQLFLNHRQQFAYGRPVWFQREMNRHGVLLVAWAHPEIVRGNRADFRDQ